MGLSELFGVVSNCIYFALGAVGLFGLYIAILLVNRINKKRFRSSAAAAEFLDEVNSLLNQRNIQGIKELCDTPQYWNKAVPQLILVALDHLDRPMNKLRKMLGERFQREVVADMEHSLSWIGSVIKTGPMLGLLGTVAGMVQAFGKIASTQNSGGDPSALANEISFALLTTAIGLIIAIPLVMISNYIIVRIGKFQDSVDEQLSDFLDELELTLQQE
jgi:biopolymer transport protein ExbB/TolQ